MSRNADLEAQIAKTPDDPGPYLVYADWLGERGDPRGELITLGVQRAKDPQNAALIEREKALHDKYDAEWLGDLAARNEAVHLAWRYGFLHAVTLGAEPKQRWGAVDIDHAEAYAELRPLAVAAFLRELTFGGFEDDSGEPSWSGATEALIEHGVVPTLRKLAYDRGGYWDISWTRLDSLAALYPLVPQLESLRIALGHFTLGDIDLPSLREFETYTGGFTKANMDEVLRARWPELERLILRFGDQEDYGAECTLDDVLPLLDATNIANVKHLGLGNAAFANEIIEPLARSKLLSRLETLDLSLGTFGDEGAAVLLEHADAFRHLQLLDVSKSFLSSDMVARLNGIAKVVKADEQDDGGNEPEDRYCHIGE